VGAYRDGGAGITAADRMAEKPDRG
jgi:hypothetical protein